MAQSRPQLVGPSPVVNLEAVRNATGGFDVDAWHCMDRRDNQLVAEEILHGAGSASFVYNFEIKGTQVAGISVVGARHLAAHYGGLKHRLVASMQKTGALFIFTSYPAEGMPMSVNASVVHALADEEDFYAAVVEMQDLKTGNAIQVERRETRYEYSRSGDRYERPHYATIAQSKAYRNAVLDLIPQDLKIRWQQEMLKLNKGEIITASVLDEKRAGVLRFATQRAIPLDRHQIEGLTLDQIAGLGDAAREGKVPAFVQAAKALGLDTGNLETVETEPAKTAAAPRGRPARKAAETASTGPAGPEPPAAEEQEQAADDKPATGTADPVSEINKQETASASSATAETRSSTGRRQVEFQV